MFYFLLLCHLQELTYIFACYLPYLAVHFQRTGRAAERSGISSDSFNLQGEYAF